MRIPITPDLAQLVEHLIRGTKVFREAYALRPLLIFFIYNKYKEIHNNSYVGVKPSAKPDLAQLVEHLTVVVSLSLKKEGF